MSFGTAAAPGASSSTRPGKVAAAMAAMSVLASCAGPPRPPAPRVPDMGPLSLKGACAQAESDGFREEANLDVDRGTVRALHWRIWVGREGACSFGLAEFQQTRARPHIELLARDRSGCKLLVYQDPRRVTLAHSGCERHCSNGVHERAWPVMFDPGSGGCADLNR